MPAYGALSTAFYDADKPTAPPDALAFYLAEARRAGGPVLEPLCGSGRFLLPLAEAGIDIDGTDASVEMLEACRNRAAARGLGPGLHLQTLQALALPRRYAMAFVPAGSIGLVDDPGAVHEGLRRIAAALQPGAVAWFEVIEFDRAPEAESSPDRRVVTLPDGGRIEYESRSRYDAAGACLHYDGRYRLWRDGRPVAEEAEQLSLRCWPAGAFAQALGAAGFAAITERRATSGWLHDSGCTLIRAEPRRGPLGSAPST